MDDNYTVIGIVQMQVRGTWSELSIRADVYAVDGDHAKAKALALYADAARHDDPFAIVRWHSPKLVRALSI